MACKSFNRELIHNSSARLCIEQKEYYKRSLARAKILVPRFKEEFKHLLPNKKVSIVIIPWFVPHLDRPYPRINVFVTGQKTYLAHAEVIV
jgi:hypothetical protein